MVNCSGCYDSIIFFVHHLNDCHYVLMRFEGLQPLVKFPVLRTQHLLTKWRGDCCRHRIGRTRLLVLAVRAQVRHAAPRCWVLITLYTLCYWRPFCFSVCTDHLKESFSWSVESYWKMKRQCGSATSEFTLCGRRLSQMHLDVVCTQVGQYNHVVDRDDYH